MGRTPPPLAPVAGELRRLDHEAELRQGAQVIAHRARCLVDELRQLADRARTLDAQDAEELQPQRVGEGAHRLRVGDGDGCRRLAAGRMSLLMGPERSCTRTLVQWFLWNRRSRRPGRSPRSKRRSGAPRSGAPRASASGGRWLGPQRAAGANRALPSGSVAPRRAARARPSGAGVARGPQRAGARVTARVCRAISSSSFVGTTSTATAESSVEMTRASRERTAFRSGSMLMPKTSRPVERTLPDDRRVLADAGREHDGVDAAELREVVADVVAQAVHVDVEGEGGIRISGHRRRSRRRACRRVRSARAGRCAC